MASIVFFYQDAIFIRMIELVDLIFLRRMIKEARLPTMKPLANTLSEQNACYVLWRQYSYQQQQQRRFSFSLGTSTTPDGHCPPWCWCNLQPSSSERTVLRLKSCKLFWTTRWIYIVPLDASSTTTIVPWPLAKAWGRAASPGRMWYL